MYVPRRCFCIARTGLKIKEGEGSCPEGDASISSLSLRSAGILIRSYSIHLLRKGQVGGLAMNRTNKGLAALSVFLSALFAPALDTAGPLNGSISGSVTFTGISPKAKPFYLSPDGALESISRAAITPPMCSLCALARKWRSQTATPFLTILQTPATQHTSLLLLL